MSQFITKYIVMPIVWLLVAIISIAFFIVDILIWLLTFWWDKRLWILHRYSCFWAMSYIWVNPFWKIDLEGNENIKKEQTYIIISNHQSAFDIALLYRLWMHFKWVAKRELFRVPIIGWNLWLNKHILIDRASVSGARKMIVEAQKNLNMGNSVLIFPEGTRSTDGTIKRFKEGAFMLAKKMNVPILPVIIEGSINVFPKKGYVLKGSQTFTMKVLKPIQPSEFADKNASELTKEMNKMYFELHSKMAPNYYTSSQN
ncbi:MAG: lysophospholipid acyltransferase family protein [Bacteroidales bacterium]|nr:lysophospholipid acyltransferase family protein [Bacteroidales bacterium]MDD3892139.1 lysophospholipid acyltransferase family protein [Bacteroidales bacterium]